MPVGYTTVTKIVMREPFTGDTFNKRLKVLDANTENYKNLINRIEADVFSIRGNISPLVKSVNDLYGRAYARRTTILYDPTDRAWESGSIYYPNDLSRFVNGGVYRINANGSLGFRNPYVLPNVDYVRYHYNIRDNLNGRWTYDNRNANVVLDKWLDDTRNNDNHVINIGLVKRFFNRMIPKSLRKSFESKFFHGSNQSNKFAWFFYVPIGFNPIKYLVICKINTNDGGGWTWHNGLQKRVWSFNGTDPVNPKENPEWNLPRVPYEVECAIMSTDGSEHDFRLNRAMVAHGKILPDNHSSLNMYFGEKENGAASVWLLMIVRR